MVRPKLCRRLRSNPEINYFKPQGVPKSTLEEVTLEHDEYETLKLANLEELSQAEAATKMEISQSTFCRILKSAEKKIAKAIIEGQAIKIMRGENMPNKDGTGPEGKGPMTGRRMGKCPNQDAAARGPGRGLNRGIGRGAGRGLGRR